MESFLSDLVLSNRPNFRIGRHFIFWFCWFIFFGVIYGVHWPSEVEKPVFVSFAEALIFMPVHIFLSYAIIYYLFPRYLFTGKYLSLFVGFIILLVITAFLSHLSANIFISAFRHWMGIPTFTNKLINGLMAGLRGSNTVAGFAAAIKLVKHWYVKKTENERLEKDRLKAELEVLKRQLQPHFLFNTLNNLYSLILQQSKEAPGVVVKLSELLRYILTESSKNKVALTQELGMLRGYIALESIRFGSRLDLTINIQGDMEDKFIAPLILLPFAENAFKHGANDMLEQPWVSLDVLVRGNCMKFKMINGKASTNQSAAPFSSGIGLQNVRRRLDLLYAGRSELKTLDGEDSFVVNLQMELEKS